MDGIGTSNRRTLERTTARKELLLKDPSIFFPWRRPVTVRALLVTDGILDFGLGDFGLSTFVDVLLNDKRSYVRFELTLAHLRTGVSNAAVQQGAPDIVRSIKGFAFDNPAHFAPDAFDEVWLFGIETNFHNGGYSNRTPASHYPSNQLADAELDALTAHMNNGGGIFATGDHGTLGAALGGAVDRIRGMRYWGDFGAGEVSMTGARRNDSNQIGHDAGSQFSDQSDDVPQALDLKLYSTWAGVFRQARYPHPVLCSRLGRIDVFPDHPHEGEVRVPPNLGLACRDGSPEFPGPAPEVVAHGRVPTGNRAIIDDQPTKDATIAHGFGVVSTYDGHAGAVGRVVCDSTWHHFVNVNLIGVVEDGQFDDFPDFDVNGNLVNGTPGTHPSKHIGFLASPAGRAALDKIKEYYVNVGVWIAPATKQAAMRATFWWDVLWADRVVEATLERIDTPLSDVRLDELLGVGVHARDVIGRLAGACQSVHWIVPWFEEIYIELVPEIDPWWLWRPDRELKNPPLPFVDVGLLVDVAIGGALVALRQAYPYPPADAKQMDDMDLQVAFKGAAEALARGLDALDIELGTSKRLVDGGRDAVRRVLG